MKFSTLIAGLIVSLLFLQVSSLRLAPGSLDKGSPTLNKRKTGDIELPLHQKQEIPIKKHQVIYEKQSPLKKQDDRNLYRVGTQNLKNQKDKVGNSVNHFNKRNDNQFEKVKNNKWGSNEKRDTFTKRSNFKDNAFNKRNSKSSENDDLDKNSDALKFSKSNRNQKNQLKKVLYNNFQDDTDRNQFDKLNDNKFKKNSAKNSNHKSTAFHGESTDNTMTNTGLSVPRYGKKSYGKNSAPTHFSRKKHQQNHSFKNADNNANKKQLNSSSKNASKKVSLRKRKRGTNFDKINDSKDYSETHLGFEKKNDNLKQRRNKDFKDSSIEKRNVGKENDLKKNWIKKANDGESNLVVHSKKLQKINKANKNYYQDHKFGANNARAKKITRDYTNGKSYH
eukprot:gene7787-12261_t